MSTLSTKLAAAAKSYLLRYALKHFVGESAVSTLARGLVDKDGNVVMEADGATPAVTLGGSQTLTNKLLTAASNFFADGTTPTKKVGFSVSGASSSTTTTIAAAQTADRTLTLPDASDTIVGRATTDTLTNKTLTANINADTKFCSAQVDKTSSTALADITGLTGISLVAGATYEFEIFLSGTAGASGGWKVAFNYTTATLTSIEAVGQGFTASAVATQHTTTTTTQTSLFAQTAAVIAARISGRMVVNAAGTLAVQFAQNASDGTTCSVYAGSKARFTRTA